MGDMVWQSLSWIGLQAHVFAICLCFKTFQTFGNPYWGVIIGMLVKRMLCTGWANVRTRISAKCVPFYRLLDSCRNTNAANQFYHHLGSSPKSRSCPPTHHQIIPFGRLWKRSQFVSKKANYVRMRQWTCWWCNDSISLSILLVCNHIPSFWCSIHVLGFGWNGCLRRNSPRFSR